MTTIRTQLRTAAILAATAFASGGCGAGDDEKIRSVVGDVQQAIKKEKWPHACDRLTARAVAQMTSLVGGSAHDCVAG